MKTSKIILSLALTFISLVFNFQKSEAHCEIPCGIYADSVRITMIREHITTIEKSMTQIMELSEADDPNYNQLVRWVVNKEEHAEKLQHIVSQYFLHQRIKLVEKSNSEAYEKYQTHLELLHKMLVYSMNCKQTTDLSFIERLRSTVTDFERAYFHTH